MRACIGELSVQVDALPSVCVRCRNSITAWSMGSSAIVSIGIDRLAMLLTGSASIRNELLLQCMRPEP